MKMILMAGVYQKSVYGQPALGGCVRLWLLRAAQL